MIILIDRGQACDKIQGPFTLKALKKLGLEENFLDVIKRDLHKNPQITSYLTVKE